MNIEIQTEHYRLKGLLNQISHISYTYSQLQKNNRTETLDNESMKKINKAFSDLLLQISTILNNEKDKLNN